MIYLAWHFDGRLFGTTSAELREMYRAWRLEPLARLLFRERPDMRSLTVAFSQYWCDEADGAVPETFRISTESSPAWVATPEELPRQRDDDGVVRDTCRRHGLPPHCDDNYTLIVAFASCCPVGPMNDFDHPPPAAWAIVRRVEGANLGGRVGVATEVLGRVHRPEWENRWDVGWESGMPASGRLEALAASSRKVRERILGLDMDPVLLLRDVEQECRDLIPLLELVATHREPISRAFERPLWEMLAAARLLAESLEAPR